MNALSMGARAAARFAEETEFDPDQVTPGAAGFFAFAALGVAIILLGFSMVRRLRRNAYRAEARERIAEELASERLAGGEDANPATREPGEDPDSPAGAGARG